VDVLGNNLHQALHARVDSQAAGVLEQHGHGRTLVQNTQLTLGALLVGRVGEDTTVKQGSVGVGDHGTNVTGAVGFLAVRGVLEAVEVLVGPVVPEGAVALVDGVDGALGGHGHVGVSEDELAQRVLEGEAVDATAAHGDDQLGGGTVHGETGGNEAGTGVEEVLGADVLAGTQELVGQLEDTEDGADGNTGVQVGGAVNGVADHGVSGVGVLVELDRVLFLFGDHDAALARAPHGGDEDVIADDVELLLVVTGGVGGTGEAGQVNQGGTTDVVGDGLERELESMAQEGEVTRSFGVLGLLFREESGEGDNVSVDVLLTDGRSARHFGRSLRVGVWWLGIGGVRYSRCLGFKGN